MFGHFELKGTPTWALEKLGVWGALSSVSLAASLRVSFLV